MLTKSILLLLFIGSYLYCGLLAYKKRRSPIRWVFACLYLPVVPLIILLRKKPNGGDERPWHEVMRKATPYIVMVFVLDIFALHMLFNNSDEENGRNGPSTVAFGEGGAQAVTSIRFDLENRSLGMPQVKVSEVTRYAIKFVTLEEDRTNAPDSAFFGRDKVDIGRDMEETASKMMAVLGDSEVVRSWSRMRAAEKALVSLKDDLADTDMRIAFEESDVLLEKRRKLLDQITTLDSRVRSESASAKIALLKSGILITDEQMSALSLNAVGDDIVYISAFISNVSDVVDGLGRTMTTQSSNPKLAKRYYASVAAVQEAVVNVYSRYVHRIESDYLPEVDRIVSLASHARSEASRLKSSESSNERIKILENNMNVQGMIIDAGKIYRRMLENNLEQAKILRDNSIKDLQVHQNTVKTVEASSGLAELYKGHDIAMKSISSMKLPPVILFKSPDLERMYRKITADMTSRSL